MKVDVMCIGAAKSGTSWLAYVLGQHPEIFIPQQKEIHYFNSRHPIRLDDNPNFKKTTDWYHAHFERAQEGQLKADFSTSYLSFSNAARAIHRYNPETKIIALLRNPVGRAISAHRFLYGRGLIKPADLIQAVEHCRAVGEDGMYYSRLMPYFEYFPIHQIGVFLHDDLAEPEDLVNQISRFLGLSPYHFDQPKNYINKTRTIKYKALHRLVTWFKLSTLGTLVVKSGMGGFFNRFYDWNSLNSGFDELSPDIEHKLKQYYKEDITKLEELIQRPLDHWK